MSENKCVVWYAAPEAPLGAGELAEVLGKTLGSQPRLAAAYRQVLAERLAAATVEASRADLPERAAGHAAGRLAELMSLQRELARYIEQADVLPRRAEGKGND